MSHVLNLTYQNLGWQTAADLYLPPDFDEQKRYPAIVSTHPIGSCKEQTAGNVYAKGLAAAGFVVLVPDASFQGASGGEPRFIEDPAIRVSDIRFAVDYLQSLSYVDSDRIGAIGVCGGGAYTIHAGITDHRLKALVSITGVNYGRLIREGFAQFKPLELAQSIARMRTAQAQGSATEPADLLPESVAAATAAGITDIDVLEATEYYKTARGQQPHGATRQLMSFTGAVMGWDAFLHAEVLLTQPLMVVIGDKAGGFGAYRDGWEIYGRAASTDKHIVVAEGWSHYDLYDKAEPVAIAMASLVPFFQRTL
ncbi:alpha/beta hydrolase [Aeromonas hydrophila]|uniref:alpha/beta hydrolase n=1 Tax=Aeromonas hydrophila TaxID=644 RepID=UPI000332AE62|nr:alpha/beta hydrolase [Aeromonas hydrophila]AGM44296.1 alpha/beta fold family hydrolase [Aeromonas hydrophila ML09-119]AHX32966.1 alpha/beta hydrolase [Aeromonas hydrophila subsp. hydrophila AL09-71]AHX69764.1 alpha/beta hydrolase [Aeromonas hydrophila pc104A]AJE36194.1 alpha/beta hydrolase [Aeromonas hydrophila J-1]AKJ34453.1 alpha/beta hydrolase [Aeromonas hydrophila NJ-35]